MFPVEITTDRLRLSRLTRDRIDPYTLYEYAGRSPTIAEETRHMTWSPHAHPKETRDFLVRCEDGWESGDQAPYAVYSREDVDDVETADPDAGEDDTLGDVFAGTTGLHFEWDKRTASLGLWLRKPFWGRGYSGERARALAALAFDHLDLDLVEAVCYPENEQSRRAIEKYVEALGGRYEGRLRNWVVDAADAVHDVHRYTVSQAEWREAAGGDVDVTVRWE